MDNSSKWNLCVCNPYQVEDKSVCNFQFSKVEKNKEKLYKISKCLSKGNGTLLERLNNGEGIVYEITYKPGISKAVKLSYANLEKKCLDKIYRDKEVGIVLPPECVSKIDNLHIKIMPLYDADLCGLLGDKEFVFDALLAETAIRQLVCGLSSLHRVKIAACTILPKNILYQNRDGYNVRFDLSNLDKFAQNLHSSEVSKEIKKELLDQDKNQLFKVIKEIVLHIGEHNFNSRFLKMLNEESIHSIRQFEKKLDKIDFITQ